MMNKVDLYINELLQEIEDLPSQYIEDALEYYKSFILDAKEAKTSEEEILLQLGSVVEVANQIKLDYYLKNQNSVSKLFLKIFKILKSSEIIEKSASYFLALLTFCSSLLMYLMSLISYISIIGWVALLGREYIITPSNYSSTKLSLFGLALLGGALLALLGYMFQKISKLLSGYTMRLIKSKLHKELTVKEERRIKNRFPLIIAVYTGFLVVGFVILLITPMFRNATSIWLSLPAKSYKLIEDDFKQEDVNRIDINAVNIKISIEYEDTDYISVIYQKENWMNYNTNLQNDTLYISETGNGKLPFMNFVGRHYSTNELAIVLPDNFKESININTIGSIVETQQIREDFHLFADTSVVNFNYIDTCNLNINTIRGRITIDNQEIETNNYKWEEENNICLIEINTVSGSVNGVNR
ncbi:DUF4097 family beta strand repeat-containing protein [Mycoplasmatota bacterium zrk1]